MSLNKENKKKSSTTCLVLRQNLFSFSFDLVWSNHDCAFDEPVSITIVEPKRKKKSEWRAIQSLQVTLRSVNSKSRVLLAQVQVPRQSRSKLHLQVAATSSSRLVPSLLTGYVDLNFTELLISPIIASPSHFLILLATKRRRSWV